MSHIEKQDIVPLRMACLALLAQAGVYFLLNWKILGSNAGQVQWVS